MVIGTAGFVPIAGPPPQSRGGAAPSLLVPSHPEISCALTMPLNRPIFPGSGDAQGPAFAFPPAAEPVAVSTPAAAKPAASSKQSFLIIPPTFFQVPSARPSARGPKTSVRNGILQILFAFVLRFARAAVFRMTLSDV